MILKAFLEFFRLIFYGPLFSFFNLPHLPTEFMESFTVFADMIFSNAGCIGFFVRPATLQLVIPLVISLISFEKIYYLVMWILKKVPFVSVR